MKTRSIPIGVRLTAWYFVFMAVGMLALGWLALAEMKRSIRSTVDEQLADRMKGVQELIIQNATARSGDALVGDLTKHSQLETEETLLQVRDESGNWIFQSPWLRYHPLPDSLEPTAAGPFADVKVAKSPLRVMTATIAAGGHTYRVQAAVEMDDFYAAVSRFRHVLLILVPVLLGAASAAGHWMSRKALAPVDRITKAAQDINYHNLSARVVVPSSGDELNRLAETFNAMLERIETSIKRTTRFTADASHELRTPIAIMRTRAELALRRPRTEAEYRDTLGKLHEELVRTSELVERLMLLARTDSGIDLLHRDRVDLTCTAREALKNIEPLIEERKLTMQVDIAERVVWSEGDPQLLRQLFVILLDNAVKYTPAPGKVSVSLSTTDDHAVFAVFDTGIGIEASELKNVFDRFYRADEARSRESGGAGLGLAIGLWIAEAHGGSIVAKSTPGAGSEFRVLLPLLKTENQSAGAASPNPKSVCRT